MLLSICIPSYNRGHRAMQLIESLLTLAYEKSDIEFIISDNGSTQYREEYRKISEIKDNRLHYHRFEKNMGYMKNLNQVIRMAQGEYCMLISDEDSICFENIQDYLDILSNTDDLAIMKSRNTIHYKDWSSIIANPGRDALENFYMAGNYMSGVIYNRRLLINRIINDYEKRYSNNAAYIYYPHMFYDSYMLLQGKFIMGDKLLINEGLSENDYEDKHLVAGIEVAAYERYESRIGQMMGFIEQIRDLDARVSDKFYMFNKVCNKYIYLLLLVYSETGNDIQGLMQGLELFNKEMKRGIRRLNLPLNSSEISDVDDYIDGLTNYVNVFEQNGISLMED